MCKLSYNLLAPIPALSAVRWEINCLGWQEWMRERHWRTAPLLLLVCGQTSHYLCMWCLPGDATLCQKALQLFLTVRVYQLRPEDFFLKEPHQGTAITCKGRKRVSALILRKGTYQNNFLRRRQKQRLHNPQPARESCEQSYTQSTSQTTCLEPFTAEVTRLSPA